MKSSTFTLLASGLVLAFAGAASAQDTEIEFDRADVDDDGLVSQAELANEEALSSALAFDLDQDGAVSREEWRKYCADAAARKSAG